MEEEPKVVSNSKRTSVAENKNQQNPMSDAPRREKPAVAATPAERSGKSAASLDRVDVSCQKQTPIARSESKFK